MRNHPETIAVFVEPISHHFTEDRLFDPHAYPGSYYQPFARIRELLEPAGIEVHTADLLETSAYARERNVYFSIGNLKRYKQLSRRIDVTLSGLFHFEAPIVHPSTYRGTPEAARYFNRIYSFSTPQGLAPFGCGDVALEKFCIPQPFDQVFDELWQRRDRKFLALVSQNKLPVLDYNELYTERLRALEHFAKTDEIDLYGIGWDQMPFRVGERKLPPHLVRLYRFLRTRVPLGKLHPYAAVIKQVYRGPVESKYETLSGYTFALTYENQVLDGWVNEKLFDAMLAGAVPIYLGAPDITAYVPNDCFIDKRDFATYGELRDYLRSLSPGDVETYRQNARDYLSSEMYRPFTKDAFAEIFVRAVEADTGVELAAVNA